MAQKHLSPINANNNKVTNVTSGTAAGDAVNKGQLDALAANAVGAVVHGSTAGTARPTGYLIVIWIGSVTPTNAAANDIWHNTA